MLRPFDGRVNCVDDGGSRIYAGPGSLLPNEEMKMILIGVARGTNVTRDIRAFFAGREEQEVIGEVGPFSIGSATGVQGIGFVEDRYVRGVLMHRLIERIMEEPRGPLALSTSLPLVIGLSVRGDQLRARLLRTEDGKDGYETHPSGKEWWSKHGFR